MFRKVRGLELLPVEPCPASTPGGVRGPPACLDKGHWARGPAVTCAHVSPTGRVPHPAALGVPGGGGSLCVRRPHLHSTSPGRSRGCLDLPFINICQAAELPGVGDIHSQESGWCCTSSSEGSGGGGGSGGQRTTKADPGSWGPDPPLRPVASELLAKPFLPFSEIRLNVCSCRA